VSELSNLFQLVPERYQEHRSEIDFELNMFRRFPKLKAYFDSIKEKGVKVSNAPNSWVAWALGITDQKPNGKMVIDSPNPPDIDLDFSNRDPVVDYIFERYGEDKTAMVGTYLSIKTKYALKDIARWQNGGHLSNEDSIHKITRTIDAAPQTTPDEISFLKGYTDDDGHYHRGHLEDNPLLKNYLDCNPEVSEMLFKILGKPRSAGKHAGGVVITPGPIDDVIPTRYYEGKKCTQISFKVLEKIGGMKIDILGVNTLNWIWDTVWLAKQRHGVDLNPWELPDDPEVWKMVSRGDVETMFQFDTDTVIPFLKRIKPTSIHDLILITSICRPGGLDSFLEDGESVAEHFVKRARGEEKVEFLDPLLHDILGDTYGLVVFQEQIQKIFEVIGGMTPIESDNARRAVGKKDEKLMIAQKGKLFEGATKLGWSLEKSERLWQSFIGAANYSFNRAHACAYAVIAYACAYLKKNHPLEWWRSVLSYAPPEKVSEYLPNIVTFILYPNVNRPAHKWVIQGDKIVAPLSLVRSVGSKATEEILKQSETGLFTSFVDFMLRISKSKVNKTVVTNLILAGAFEGLPVCDGEPPPESMGKYIEKLFELRDEPVPESFTDLDKKKLVFLRKNVLPIYTINFVKHFIDTLKAEKDFSVFQKLLCLSGCPIVSNFSKFEAIRSSLGDGEICIVGMVEASEMFYYVSKSGKQVGQKFGALRVTIENDGRKTEFVVWPDGLKSIDKKALAAGNIVAAFGTLKYNSFRDEVGLSLTSVRKLI
jgi:DNA polymerase-3 subunit alpha